MRATVHHTTVELQQGDITAQSDVEAVVNAANAQLRTGGGVAGAIHRAAGPELAEACRPLAPIEPGEAVLTEAFGLPNDYVIHCLGPVYGRDEPSDELLSDCYRNALEIAENEDITSVAFPALSTGAFGYPMEDAAAVALRTVQDVVSSLEDIELVRFVLYDDNALRVHEERFQALLDGER